jgi:splicing factor 3B subunit 2
LSIDASELENMSDEQLRRRYESASKGSAGVPGAHGQEDFSDMVAKEMAGRSKKQKVTDNKKSGSSKEFKF